MITQEKIDNTAKDYYNHYSKIVEMFPEREESLRDEAENAGFILSFWNELENLNAANFYFDDDQWVGFVEIDNGDIEFQYEDRDDYYDYHGNDLFHDVELKNGLIVDLIENIRDVFEEEWNLNGEEDDVEIANMILEYLEN